MAGQSTLDEAAPDTNTFYRRTLHVLSDGAVPFLVGGSHAFLEYTGIVRNTKDFDLFLRRSDIDRAMEALGAAGYRTELTFPHWLGKAWQHEDFVDLVFSSGNGICAVDDGWFEHAVETQVHGTILTGMPSTCVSTAWLNQPSSIGQTPLPELNTRSTKSSCCHALPSQCGKVSSVR